MTAGKTALFFMAERCTGRFNRIQTVERVGFDSYAAAKFRGEYIVRAPETGVGLEKPPARLGDSQAGVVLILGGSMGANTVQGFEPCDLCVDGGPLLFKFGKAGLIGGG